MKVKAAAINLAELDACHLQIRAHLDRLAALASRVQAEGPDAEIRAEARAIEAFFSGSMCRHHRMEEESVFPPLLDSGDAELVTAVRTAQQDHGWIEENWIEIAPRLRAIADGEHWVEPAEFVHGVELFLELCYGHAAFEELLIYPQARARQVGAQGLQIAATTT